MAKAKKEKLSLEELLEQALVKEEDRPYEVPKNWVWTKLVGVLSEIKNGTTITQNKEKIGDMVTRIESIQNNRIDFNRIGYIADTSKIKETDWYIANDIALSHINSAEHVGKTAIITQELLPLVHGMNLLRLRFNSACSANYLYYFTQSFDYKQSIMNRINMAVNQVSINQKQVNDIPMPLPTLAEQQRIVAVIESLFEKLDTAKELAQNALDSFENRKAAILHKAFIGELTAKWREENGVGLDEWKKYEIKDLVTKLNQGWSPKCETFPAKSNEKWGVIKTTAIQHMEFIEGENKQLPNDLQPREKHELKEGDILITRAGPRIRVGVCCLVKTVRPKLLLCDKAYRFRVNENMILPEYIVFVLNTTDILHEINKMKTGISDSGVNLTQNGFLEIKLRVPSIREQKEIIHILDNILQNEQAAKELCDVIEKIDLMKKAILARAFRGELGTNDPDEESAVELLKEVLKENI